MYRLTDERFEKAEPILEKYRAKLHATGRIDAKALQNELRRCWHAGDREVKDIFKRLSKTSHYKYLAAYCMEHSGLMEFWPTLNTLYGVAYHHSPMRETKRKAFWRKFRTK